MTVPRRIAALPNYIGSASNKAFAESAPGHKFLGYFRNFQDSDARAFDPYKGKAKLVTPLPLPGPQNRAEQAQLKAEFDAVLNEVCKLPASSIAQINALRARQRALIANYGTNAVRITTTSTAPFATGLGNEHPIENGFAFLTPYGLPYLAGSGVKGILRRSMQELQDDGEDGFTTEAIDALFGSETVNQSENAQRGALDFWDVFPNPASGKLVVEIMTPHFGKYYQGSETPHDSGAPVPVSFLAVPAKSEFDFHVVCQSGRLPAALQDQWRKLLDRVFQHAFEWVGFGAKTAVGYGAMAAASSPRALADASGKVSGTSSSITNAFANTSLGHTWPTAKLTLNPGTGEITASFNGKSTAPLKNPQANELRDALGEERANKFKKNKELKGISVEVVQLGNALQLKGLCTS
ncbi:MAG: type III-B CRISPR module RAMP protein Cmr6 [Betaproteobacteria bacterium]|nr:type III-B CRISPR module RAMP protein Cmr6 [Betaproteobacteria bacterium]PIZ22328.1 MAG: type III-B CRISPR module RAMP protein Cmr6 [Comamonadaceae bacterium CG_4_10_14_0_8_um_filter_57_29]PJC17431.1 MAG: type III-B CRISPR module RAMP protein Cmr6 [Comamonadaceae bacterium CG_4_9_14_0_8_um_filter_57_21]